jgi:hypothetical protein
MADRVDAAMDQVQRAAPKPSGDRAAADPKLSKLPTRHNPVLTLRERSNHRIQERSVRAVLPVFDIA